MKKNAFFILLIIYTILSTACSNTKNGLNPKKPITISMWHNFGGNMQKIMDSLVDEFNSTVGLKQGIIINVTAIASSADLQEMLQMIADGVPGAPQLPDLSTSYPKTAFQFQSKGLLANLDNYFSEQELASYVPAFVEEGRFGDNGLYVFPIAKSTEILYLNQTLFDRFSAETGITMDCFSTFEGIADAARQYYEWTDAKTPDVTNDGKQFFAADSWFNLAQAGMLQKKSSLFQNDALNLNNDTYHHIWETCYLPSVSGGFAIYDGYSSDLSKTGDLVCSTGSSAGILFYGDTISYPDNTVEQVEYSILPYPIFEGGEKLAIQRGNGFMVAASDQTREYASAVFLKWFTAPEQNMRFVASTGYLPVTNEAFEKQMPKQMEQVENILIKKMLTAVLKMHNEYNFFVAPVFEGFDQLAAGYENCFLNRMASEQKEAMDTSDDMQLKKRLNDAYIQFITEE